MIPVHFSHLGGSCLGCPGSARSAPSPAPTAPADGDQRSVLPQRNQPSRVAEQYFTEEFDQDSGNWSHFVVDDSIELTSPGSAPSLASDDVEEMSVGISGGHLVFDLESKEVWCVCHL